jgi:hypothetical protein
VAAISLHCRGVSPLLILLVGGAVAVGLWSWLAHRDGRAPRPRTDDLLGLRSPREIVEDRAALEAEDLGQMLAAHNARRRRRGESAQTVEDIELIVAAGLRDQRRRREALLADRDLEQLLDATNARRRARGLPERTRDQVRAQYGGGG